MHTRIKMVREKLKLNQTEFASRIEIKQSTLSANESGLRPASDRTISAICREFNINEDWLRTGKGEMVSHDTVDPLEELCRQRGLSPLACGIVKDFVELDADQREAFLAIARRLFAAGESAARSAQSAAIRSSAAMSERPNPVPSEENPDSRAAN